MTGVIISLLLAFAANAFAARLLSVGSHPWVARPRQALLRRKGIDHWASVLITCPWCISAWTATPITIAWWHTQAATQLPLPWWFAIPALTATFSYGYGLLATNLDPE